MSRILNIAAYRFVPLPDANLLLEPLRQRADALGLKGTVLLAPEGINLFLAGEAVNLREWLTQLRRDARFAAIEVKESWSDAQPFAKLKVKLKREIIRMNSPQIAPGHGAGQRAPAVDAATLTRWLEAGHDDAGRPVVMLDTRNGFEVDAGAFNHALDWRLGKFSDFPAALAEHKAELAGKTVVTYCTGGIRCEKAALLMHAEGLAHTYQLDGGILKYFEQLGTKQTHAGRPEAPHYRGVCFVFDDRRELDAALSTRSSMATEPASPEMP